MSPDHFPRRIFAFPGRIFAAHWTEIRPAGNKARFGQFSDMHAAAAGHIRDAAAPVQVCFNQSQVFL